ncbi:hypothetical protein MKX07_001679 [Trichoderma sp. CBMAI-0711]|nr:hypothetical protein MKX07_001679 [Trichoderma sp. CBMAI-0711]
MILLPAALLALVSEVAAEQPVATAIKKQLPNPNEKLFPDHLAFEALPQLATYETANLWLDDNDEDSSTNSTKRYRPAFSNHFQNPEENLLRRAANVLRILQNRAACPTSGATGAPPWRPTDVTSTSASVSSSSSVSSTAFSSTSSAPPRSTTRSGETQTGCPTGFYGCLATHGGGCCRTDRDCQTSSCPAPSTTIKSHGVTVVVPANDVPTATASDECASGWFLCGKDAGAVAGCCPSGYKCGTASCFTSSASETNSLQKQQPEPEAPNKSAAARSMRCSHWLALGSVAGSLLLLSGSMW